jgi:hypothetical protein
MYRQTGPRARHYDVSVTLQVYVHDGADVILGPDLLADDGATLVVVADDAGFQLHVAWTGEWWWWHYGAWYAHAGDAGPRY